MRILVAILAVALINISGAADVLSTWDGSTNSWSSQTNWAHSAQSIAGYPSNGVQTYSVLLTNGQVTISRPVTIDSLELAGGHLIVEEPLTILSNALWQGGEITSFSPVEFRGGVQMQGSTPKKWDGPITTYGASVVSGPPALSFNGQWQNYGDLELAGSLVISNFGYSPLLRNYGRISKTGDGEVTFLTPMFMNMGRLDIEAGVLNFKGRSDFAGLITIAPDARFLLGAVSHISSNCVISGEGSMVLDSGYLYADDGGLTLSNARVQIVRGGIGNGDPKASRLYIDPLSVISLSGTNDGQDNSEPSSLYCVNGTNAGLVVVETTGRSSLGIANQGLVELKARGAVNTNIRNEGQIIKSGEDVHTYLNGSLINNGVIDVRGGLLESAVSGINAGTMLAGAGSTNFVTSGHGDYPGTFVFADGSRTMGAGQHIIYDAAIYGVLTNEGKLALRYTFGDGTILNRSGAKLDFGWLGSATVVNEGSAIAGTYGAGATVWNRGMLFWHSGEWEGAIHNEGAIIKTSSNLFTVTPNTIISNRASLHIEEGGVTFANAFTNTSRIVVEPAALLTAESDFVLESGAEIQGDGNVRVVWGGNLIVAASVTNRVSTTVTAGTLTAVADYTIGRSLTVTNGRIRGPGDIVVASNAIAEVIGSYVDGPGLLKVNRGGMLTLNGMSKSVTEVNRRIESDGTLQLSGTLEGDEVIVNRGTGSGAGEWSLSLVNYGCFRVASNTVLALWHGGGAITNRGLMEVSGLLNGEVAAPVVQEAGELRLIGGTIRSDLQLDGGMLTGSGTNRGILQSFGGAISPGTPFDSIGSIHTSELRLAPGSSLEFDLGGTNSGAFDRVTVEWDLWCSNDVTIVVRLANGYVPQLGDQFEVMRFHWGFGSPWNPVPVHYPRFKGLTLPNGLRLAPVIEFRSLVFVVTDAPAVDPQVLRIAPSGNGHLRLSWPPEYAGFILQTSTNLTTWEDRAVTGHATPWMLAGGEWYRFYRLIDSEIAK